MEKQGQVQQYYGKTLSTSSDLATNACSMARLPSAYKSILAELHPEVTAKFYGCGSPIPSQLQGCTVLDLGCGGGTDSYVASKLVGEEGRVIGVDMTEEMIATAIKHQDYHRDKFGFKKSNVDFRRGRIQDLSSCGVEDESVDVVISNCVINLVPSKLQVFREIHRVLKKGGEFYFADMYSDRRVPNDVQKNQQLWGEGLSGALYQQDFRRMMAQVGFNDVRLVSKSNITINNPALEKMVKNVKYFSCTYRAFKLQLEDRPEDYGQVACYTGKDCEFELDMQHRFKKDADVPICRNTATILQESRYCKLFVVSQEEEHRGLKQVEVMLKSCC